MNAELFELYNSKWNDLTSAIKVVLDVPFLTEKPTNPLLLKIKDEEGFKKSEIRIMIFGQETNDWEKDFHLDLEENLNLYDGFFNSENSNQKRGQFWNGIRKFISLLENKYTGKKIRFIWNNIVKIGKSDGKGFPPDYVYGIEKSTFPVIKEELNIIQPNLVLFFTGPDYDWVIENNFGKVKYQALSPFTERQLSQVFLENVPYSFRTYHPNYLWRNKIDDYFESIINQINF